METTKDKKGILTTKELNVLRIPIVFTPREHKKYDQIISFDVNGLQKIDVRITGEGIPLKLELEHTEDQHIDFGIARVNSEITKSVSVVNMSKKAISITFDANNQLDDLEKSHISIAPNTPFIILPKERKPVEITFHPTARLHTFHKDLFYRIVDNQE